MDRTQSVSWLTLVLDVGVRNRGIIVLNGEVRSGEAAMSDGGQQQHLMGE